MKYWGIQAEQEKKEQKKDALKQTVFASIVILTELINYLQWWLFRWN